MRWWYKVAIGIIAAIVVIYLGTSIFIGLTMTKARRLPLESTPADMGLEYTDVSFLSEEDGLTLKGWHIKAAEESEEIIILVHGTDGNRATKKKNYPAVIKGIVEHGYDMLTFDLRGHGESEGNRISAGYYEVRDLAGAVKYAKSLGYKEIGVLGFSMGAVTAIRTAAVNTDINAVVTDSCVAHLEGIIAPEFSKRTRFPEFFFPPLMWMVKIIYGIDFMAIRPVDSVVSIAPRPILFIHGELDQMIPYEHASMLMEASDNPDNELWIVPGVGHTETLVKMPEEYINRVTGFFDKVFR